MQSDVEGKCGHMGDIVDLTFEKRIKRQLCTYSFTLALVGPIDALLATAATS